MPRTSRKNIFQEQPTTNNILKAVTYATWGYARISNDGEKSEDSIESQTAIIQDYVSDVSRTDLELKGVITDVGFSGTNFVRPGYAELLSGIISGDVQCVVVKDLSRLGRTYIEVGELLFDTFPTYNIRFISVNDQYDSFADDAARKKLLILFKNLVNHMYSKDLGVKIRSSHALKQQKGELLGSLPPYGYMFTTEGGGKRLKIEPESSKVVKMIFDMRERGDSMVKITEHLNHNNIPAPRNHYYNLGVLTSEKNSKKAFWHNGFIGNLLKNEVYIGNQIQSKYSRRGNAVVEKPKSDWYVYENAHTAIIDKTQFDNVQRLLSEAGEKYKKLGNKLDENFFIGKIFCARCGRTMKRGYSRNRKILADGRQETKYHYSCRLCSAEMRHSLNIDKVPQFTYEKLEKVVIAVLQRQIAVCIDIDALIEDVTTSAPITSKCHNLKQEMERCQRDSKKAEDMLAVAYTHHLAGLLDDNDLIKARAKFEKDKRTAEIKEALAKAELERYDLDNQRRNAFLANFRNFKGFTKLDRAIISTLIHRIEISPLTNEISIALNFMDELEKLNSLIKESGVLTDAC